MSSNGHGVEHDQEEHHEHHVLPDRIGLIVFIALLIGTAVTVWTAGIDLGKLNFSLAMLIATVKAMLVIFFFMGLKYDVNENRTIFFSGFVFMGIFLTLTFTDLFARGPVHLDVNKVKETFASIPGAGPPKIKFMKFWEPRDEMLAHGKMLYAANCTSCHGNEGKGDGPAASGLKPPPRNFTFGSDWKSGRKPSQIYGTLTKGLNQMPAFGTLPIDDRWALAHFVNSLGPTPPKDVAADWKAAGIDPSKEDGGLGGGLRALPPEFAIELLAEDGKR